MSLLLEAYFQEIQVLVANCSIVQSSNLLYESRSRDRGFLRGELRFENGSVLSVREFVNVAADEIREMYAYQYMDIENNLIFRYDNTGHHQKLNLPTFPHHKHEGREDNVVAATAPTLAEVLQEIADFWG